MSTLTIRLPDDQHDRLRTLASQRGVSLNKLFEEFSTKAIAEFDTENRYRLRAATRRKVLRFWICWIGSTRSELLS